MSSRLEQFQSLVARHPDNEMFRFSLAQALAAGGHATEALAHYEFCVSKRADWMMARILMGKLLLQLGRPGEARPLLAAALQLAVEQHHDDPAQELRELLAEL